MVKKKIKGKGKKPKAGKQTAKDKTGDLPQTKCG